MVSFITTEYAIKNLNNNSTLKVNPNQLISLEDCKCHS